MDRASNIQQRNTPTQKLTPFTDIRKACEEAKGTHYLYVTNNNRGKDSISTTKEKPKENDPEYKSPADFIIRGLREEHGLSDRVARRLLTHIGKKDLSKKQGASLRTVEDLRSLGEIIDHRIERNKALSELRERFSPEYGCKAADMAAVACMNMWDMENPVEELSKKDIETTFRRELVKSFNTTGKDMLNTPRLKDIFTEVGAFEHVLKKHSGIILSSKIIEFDHKDIKDMKDWLVLGGVVFSLDNTFSMEPKDFLRQLRFAAQQLLGGEANDFMDQADIAFKPLIEGERDNLAFKQAAAAQASSLLKKVGSKFGVAAETLSTKALSEREIEKLFTDRLKIKLAERSPEKTAASATKQNAPHMGAATGGALASQGGELSKSEGPRQGPEPQPRSATGTFATTADLLGAEIALDDQWSREPGQGPEPQPRSAIGTFATTLDSHGKPMQAAKPLIPALNLPARTSILSPPPQPADQEPLLPRESRRRERAEIVYEKRETYKGNRGQSAKIARPKTSNASGSSAQKRLERGTSLSKLPRSSGRALAARTAKPSDQKTPKRPKRERTASAPGTPRALASRKAVNASSRKGAADMNGLQLALEALVDSNNLINAGILFGRANEEAQT